MDPNAKPTSPTKPTNPTKPTETTYTVTFNANGGTGTMASKTYTVGKSGELPGNNFTYAGKRFVGWNTKPDGTGETIIGSIYEDASYAGKTVTLYAQWVTESHALISVSLSAAGKDIKADSYVTMSDAVKRTVSADGSTVTFEVATDKPHTMTITAPDGYEIDTVYTTETGDSLTVADGKKFTYTFDANTLEDDGSNVYVYLSHTGYKTISIMVNNENGKITPKAGNARLIDTTDANEARLPEYIYEVKEGVDVSFTVTPNSGYEIIGVSDESGAKTITDPSSYTLTFPKVTEDKFASIDFNKKGEATLHINATGATATVTGSTKSSEESGGYVAYTFKKGDKPTITFKPDTAWGKPYTLESARVHYYGADGEKEIALTGNSITLDALPAGDSWIDVTYKPADSVTIGTDLNAGADTSSDAGTIGVSSGLISAPYYPGGYYAEKGSTPVLTLSVNSGYELNYVSISGTGRDETLKASDLKKDSSGKYLIPIKNVTDSTYVTCYVRQQGIRSFGVSYGSNVKSVTYSGATAKGNSRASYKQGSDAKVTFTLAQGYEITSATLYKGMYTWGELASELDPSSAQYDSATNSYTFTVKNIQDDMTLSVATSLASYVQLDVYNQTDLKITAANDAARVEGDGAQQTFYAKVGEVVKFNIAPANSDYEIYGFWTDVQNTGICSYENGVLTVDKPNEGSSIPVSIYTRPKGTREVNASGDEHVSSVSLGGTGFVSNDTISSDA